MSETVVDRHICLDCGVDAAAIGEYYMLFDDVWAATGVGCDGGQLCIGCVENRLNRRLEPGDFRPVGINLFFPGDLWPETRWHRSVRLLSRLGATGRLLERLA